MVSNLIRNQAPLRGLRVRVPCPPLGSTGLKRVAGAPPDIAPIENGLAVPQLNHPPSQARCSATGSRPSALRKRAGQTEPHKDQRGWFGDVD